MSAMTGSCAKAASTLPKPMATRPALRAIARASRAALSSNASVRAMRSLAIRTSRRNEHAKARVLIARSSVVRVAVTHTPRPGRLRLRSTTTSPPGAMTKRIMVSTGRTARVAMQYRSSPRDCGPRSSSTWFCCANTDKFDPIYLVDPADLDPGAHDERFSLLAAQLHTFENTGLAYRFAVFALGPAGKIVGRAASKIFNCLDSVLAETHQHSGRDALDVPKSVLDAELTALVVKLGLNSSEVFARTILQFGRGALVETFDIGNFLGIDHGQLFDRGETFRRQQLADHFIDIEHVDEHFGPVFELGLAAFGLFLLGENVDVPAG